MKEYILQILINNESGKPIEAGTKVGWEQGSLKSVGESGVSGHIEGYSLEVLDGPFAGTFISVAADQFNTFLRDAE